MNKIRIIGLLILITGLISIYFFDNEGIDFIAGILIGLGIGLSLFGRITFKNQIDIT